eukprot:NODE_846_length_3555_cov_0.991030.p4 type:complete len:175 gc:universal NODE_846_length_3555_cov_0.991030:2345-1821(-)
MANIVGLIDKVISTKDEDFVQSKVDMSQFCILPVKKVEIGKLPEKCRKTSDPKALETENWFSLPVQKITPEIKLDLLALQSRSVLNPKRHFKKNKSKLPERFLMGEIVAPQSEYFSSRLFKKERKSTLFDEMMRDPDTQAYLKRKTQEIHRKNQNNSTFKKKKEINVKRLLYIK